MNRIEVATQQVQAFLQKTPLLGRVDRMHSPERLLHFAVGEVHELREALAEPDPSLAADELNDAWVFTAAALFQFLPDIDLSTATDRLNGQGRNLPRALEQLPEVILAIKDEPGRAGVEVARRVLSIAKYLPHQPDPHLEHFSATITKASRNRPSVLYHDVEAGRRLNDEEALAKHSYLEKATRLLRRMTGQTLSPIVLQPYQSELMRWREPALSLHALQAKYLSEKQTRQEQRDHAASA